MDCESIAQAVWANVMNYAGLTVNQPRQSSSFTAVPHNLPSAVAINAKNQCLSISNNRTTAPDVFLKQRYGIAVNWQCPLPAVQLLFALTRLYPAATFRAKDMSRPESRSTHTAGKLDVILEMLNGDRTTRKIYVLNLKPQCLADTTT
jgi:hypothetical protein